MAKKKGIEMAIFMLNIVVVVVVVVALSDFLSFFGIVVEFYLKSVESFLSCLLIIEQDKS